MEGNFHTPQPPLREGEYCLVYDLVRGVFYKFLLEQPLVKGYFRRNHGSRNMFFNDFNELLSYPHPPAPSLELIRRVKTKVFYNRSKLKKIVTKSAFSKMTVKRESRRGFEEASPEATFRCNEAGVYILPAGFKGDLTLEFEGVENLCLLEMFFR